MTTEITQADEEGVVHARISGVMTPADQQALEGLARRLINAGLTLSLLVTLEEFEGWKRDPAWEDDLDFIASHGNAVARIAKPDASSATMRSTNTEERICWSNVRGPSTGSELSSRRAISRAADASASPPVPLRT